MKTETDFLNNSSSQMLEIKKRNAYLVTMQQLKAENFQRLKAGLLPYVEYLDCTKGELMTTLYNRDELAGVDTALPQNWLDSIARDTGHTSKYYSVLRFGTAWDCNKWMPLFLTQNAKNAYQLAIKTRNY